MCSQRKLKPREFEPLPGSHSWLLCGKAGTRYPSLNVGLYGEMFYLDFLVFRA